MVSTKRTEEGRSATPTTDKKKRRTSIEPENLSVAEQRQRAKEWAEKEKQKVADGIGAATADVIEKKVKRATKAKKEVEDVVEESTTEAVKVTRKSSRKPANAEEEEQVTVPSSPVIVKKTRAKRTSISVPPVVEPVETNFVSSPIRTVEQQQIVSTQSPAKSPVKSPVKSALQQQQPTSALKARTPRKQVSSSVAASPYLPVKTDDDEVAAASQQTNKANAQKTISFSSTDNSAQVEGDSDIKVVRVVDEASSFEASPSGLIAVFVLMVAWAAFVIKYIENLSVVLAVAVVGALVVSTVRRWSVFMCCGSKRKDGSHYYLTSAANNNQFMEE